MAFSKAQEFTATDQELAALARALAHPARIAILKTLAARNACICGELVSSLPLAQSTVSQHLKALRDAGLITGEVEGPTSCYCLDTSTILRFTHAFENFLGELNHLPGTISCCPSNPQHE